MTQATKNILVTGATGTIGGHLVMQYLVNTTNHLTLLVRDKGLNKAGSRVARVLGLDDQRSLPLERLRILKGDVSEPQLGLTKDEYSDVASNTNLIIHAAATTKLSDSEVNCRRVNLAGTENVLELAEAARRGGRLDRLSHISTAYVAGNRLPDKLMEDSLPGNPEFSNHYERSKYEAELRVREKMGQGLPVTIFRPSVVVGDSTTGRPGAFNVLYPLCRLLANGMLSKIPVHQDSCVNIVPIDFVVQSITAISEVPASRGKTYHLVSKTPPFMRMVAELQNFYPDMAHLFQRTQLVDPELFDPSQLPEEEQLLFQSLTPYLPYFGDHLSFDTSNMDDILPALGLQWPDTGMPFLCKLFEYVIDVGYIRSEPD